MTQMEQGYKIYYTSMMTQNIGFNHTEFWVDKVQKTIVAY
jgi:hypothetical protein